MTASATNQADPIPADESPESSSTRTKRIRFGIGLCIVVLLIAAAIPGVNWWQQRRTDQFKEACVAATANEQWERLGLIAKRWIEWDSDSNDAYVYQAEAQFQAGELQAAADSLAQVSNDYHGAIEALSFRGEILYGDLHQPYLAEATWKRMLQIDPQHTHAHQRLISFYALSLQRDKMVQQIRDSLERRCEPPEAYAYLLLANALGFTEGLVHVRNWRANLPDDETLEVAEAIYTAKYQNDPTVADSFEQSHFASGDQGPINACLRKYPQNVEVLAYHMEREIFYGNTADVVALLQSAPAKAMEDARFWRFRGWLFQQAEDYEQTIAALEKSLELDNFSWRSRWEIASVLRLKGKVAAAEGMQELAMQGKLLQDKLYQTDGRALSWGLVEEMREYIARLNEPEVLSALDARIRAQGGAQVADELIGTAGDSTGTKSQE